MDEPLNKYNSGHYQIKNLVEVTNLNIVSRVFMKLFYELWPLLINIIAVYNGRLNDDI